MANLFTRLTGINGRRIGMNSTGAIVDKNGFGCVMADSSGVLQTVIKTYVEAVSSSGAAMVAYGLSYFSSGTATAQNFTLAAPSSGQGKEIFSLTSATEVIVETTATGIYFVVAGASGERAESTRLTFSGANGVSGDVAHLRGLSSTRWAVLGTTGVV